jgi:hypothetical protein
MGTADFPDWCFFQTLLIGIRIQNYLTGYRILSF